MRLRARIEALERERKGEPGELDVAAEPRSLDLSGDDELPSVEPNRNHVLSRPWYDNFRISGYAAVTFFDTGDAGSTDDGTFVVKEATLFLDAQLWKDVELASEIRLLRYLFGGSLTIGELYLSPIGLSFVTKVAPMRIVSMMMGVWFLANFIGNYMTGYLGTFYEKMPRNQFFTMLLVIGVAAGAVLFVIGRPLDRIVSKHDRHAA